GGGARVHELRCPSAEPARPGGSRAARRPGRRGNRRDARGDRGVWREVRCSRGSVSGTPGPAAMSDPRSSLELPFDQVEGEGTMSQTTGHPVDEHPGETEQVRPLAQIAAELGTLAAEIAAHTCRFLQVL